MRYNINHIHSLLRILFSDRIIIDTEYSDNEWQSLYDIAQVQSLTGVLFKCIEKLPKDQIPDMDLLMEWLGQTEYIKQGYQIRQETAIHLTQFLSEHGIDVLMLKGFAVAKYYLEPSVREFGDLDIYVFDKCEETLKALHDAGIKVEKEEKHDVFDYEGIHIELHKYYTNNRSKTGKQINAFLLAHSKKEDCIKSAEAWYEANPTFNAIFLLRHMVKHFALEGITLKNILDYALFLKIDGDNIDWLAVKKNLQESGMDMAFDTFLFVCERVSGLDFSNYHLQERSSFEPLANKVLDDIINPIENTIPQNASVFKRTVKKYKRLMSRKWVYDCGLMPDSFWKDIVFGSVVSHIKAPKFI